MIVLASGNPFISAYTQSDFLGKGIFWALFALSFLSWTILIHKAWVYTQVRKLSKEFMAQFSEKDPLNLQFTRAKGHLIEVPNPFFEIYRALKQKTLQIINRNHYFAPNDAATLSEADLALIEAQVYSALATQHKLLGKNVYILSTIVTLGPFFGLLGTVWGILLTLSQIHSRGVSLSNSAMLSDLSMALATTVIGLLVAIPALIAYNYLKNAAREYRREMEDFSQMLLATVELQYRKPDHAQKVSTIS